MWDPDYEPNERVCRRTARLFRSHMEVPEFNQLGEDKSRYSTGEVFREGFAQAIQKKACEGTTAEQLELFEDRLYHYLVTHYPLRDWDRASEFEENIEYATNIRTDYHPVGVLLRAMQDADIPEMQAPVKSGVVLARDHLQESFGYGRFTTYHYILDDERWLVTTLQGSEEDLEHLKDLAREFPDRFYIRQNGEL